MHWGFSNGKMKITLLNHCVDGKFSSAARLYILYILNAFVTVKISQFSAEAGEETCLVPLTCMYV